MMVEYFTYVLQNKERDYGRIVLELIKGKDDIAEKLENKLFKYSELGNFVIRNLNGF